jgi:hypothetical protein
MIGDAFAAFLRICLVSFPFVALVSCGGGAAAPSRSASNAPAAGNYLWQISSA